MTGTTKNLLIILGLITVAAAGYYLFSIRSATTLDTAVSGQSLESMLQNTQVFIERRQELDQIKLDVSVLEDPRFNTLRSYSDPVEEKPIGRPDPFADVAQ